MIVADYQIIGFGCMELYELANSPILLVIEPVRAGGTRDFSRQLISMSFSDNDMVVFL